jgi:hypothetical protein
VKGLAVPARQCRVPPGKEKGGSVCYSLINQKLDFAMRDVVECTVATTEEARGMPRTMSKQALITA